MTQTISSGARRREDGGQKWKRSNREKESKMTRSYPSREIAKIRPIKASGKSGYAKNEGGGNELIHGNKQKTELLTEETGTGN